jgi:hypothetical protein
LGETIDESSRGGPPGVVNKNLDDIASALESRLFQQYFVRFGGGERVVSSQNPLSVELDIATASGGVIKSNSILRAIGVEGDGVCGQVPNRFHSERTIRGDPF